MIKKTHKQAITITSDIICEDGANVCLVWIAAHTEPKNQEYM